MFHEVRCLEEVYVQKMLPAILRYIMNLVSSDVLEGLYLIALRVGVFGFYLLPCIWRTIQFTAGVEEIYFWIEGQLEIT